MNIRKKINVAREAYHLRMKRRLFSRLSNDEKALFPDFLHIGGQKCGSSWVYENLKKHPEVYIPENRYLHFFDQNFRSSLKKYLSNFKRQEGKVKGEAIPGYGLISRERIEFIRDCNPDIKIMFIMRDPVQRAWSHAKMNFVLHQKRYLGDVSDQEFIQHFNSRLSLEKGDFMSILSKWEEILPKAQISYFYFEGIEEDPCNLLNRHFDFLGVKKVDDFSSYVINQKVNEGADYAIPPHLLRYLSNLYYEKTLRLYEKYGEDIKPWLDKIEQYR